MTVPSTEPTPPAAGDPPTTEPITPTPAPPKAVEPPKEDKPLGPAGEKALREEREARIALEKRFSRLVEALGDGDPKKGKSDVELLNERFNTYESQLTGERQARWRAEVAAEKGLPASLAARLQGSTREELVADADELKALIPATEGPRTPAPDPSQGARTPVDIDAQIREAESKGDVRTAIRLKSQKLYAQKAK